MYIIIIISRSIFVDKKLRVCVCDEKQSKIISQKNNGNVQNANELLMRRRFFPLFWNFLKTKKWLIDILEFNVVCGFVYTKGRN